MVENARDFGERENEKSSNQVSMGQNNANKPKVRVAKLLQVLSLVRSSEEDYIKTEVGRLKSNGALDV
jgi:hypothetical protein